MGRLTAKTGRRTIPFEAIRRLRCVTMATALIGLPFASLAATIEAISYSSLPGNRVQVKIELDSAVESAPLNFTIDNPARIALDFPGTGLDIESRNIFVGVGNAESVNAVEASGRSRIVVNLSQLVPYSIDTRGNQVLVTMDAIPANIDSEVGAVDETIAGLTSEAAIEDIDFRRGAAGEGLVMVKLSDPGVGVNIDEQGGRVIVDFTETSLPERLDRKLDVVDFATPAREVDTFPYGNGTRMVITPTGTYEHLAYQTDDMFTVELRPLTEQEREEAEKEKFGYTGERLSLNFQDIEVRAVLQLIADFTGLNLVAADSVSGSVTLRLKNVPWDQALDIILKSKGLGMRQAGNVLMVAPQEEIAQREKLELESQQQLRDLAPLRTEFVQIDYARAQDIADLIQSEAKNLLTDRGNISVDERTNTLLVQETAETISQIRSLIQTLDIPVRQVLIESRIVIASEDFSRDIGVRLGLSSFKEGRPDNLSNAIGGGLAGDVQYEPNTSFESPNGENYIVSLPAAVGEGPGAAFRWSVGKFGSWLLQLELSALQAEGRGEVISAPRVVTANQQKAVIEAGTEIPFQQATSSGATAIQFKSAVLRLEVTPRITPDDRIIMDLAVNKDSVGQIFNGVPAIDTNAVETQVLVDNGDTVVLGGIYESEDRSDLTSIPFFGELPYLGRLFRRSLVNSDKQELLIFVTPKILKEALAMSTR